MRKILILLLLTVSTASIAQTASLVFFSENGEKFTIIMNGLRRNEAPETNVRITDLIGAPYLVKVIFADTAFGVIDEKIYAIDDKERTFAVRARKISSSEKGIKKVGVNLGRQLEGGDKKEAAAKKEQIENTDSKYVLKLVSETASGAKAAPATPAANPTTQTPPPASNSQGTVKAGVSQSTTTTTTQVSTTGGNANGDNANISLNVNISGVATETSTTTTTTQSSSSTAASYPEPASPNRCSYPMNDGSFESAKKSIESKNFEESQVTMAKQVISNNCLSSNQVKQLMLVFSFEESRLEIAKYAYEHTFDKQNYFKVNDAFTFESSIDELNEYIESRK